MSETRVTDTRQDETVTAGPGGNRLWAAGLTLAAGLMRLGPHLWNMTPAGAAGVFSGARLPLGTALAVTLGFMLATDAVLAVGSPYPFFHNDMVFVYAGMVVNVLLGRWLVGRSNSPARIGTAALLGSVQFFLLTNFGVWLMAALNPATALVPYPPTWQGLAACYTAALPFYQGTLLGDLLYSGVLFGAYGWLTHRVPAPEAAVSERA